MRVRNRHRFFLLRTAFLRERSFPSASLRAGCFAQDDSQEQRPMATFFKTTGSYRPGARTMEGRYYNSAEILTAEQERVFASHWICVGREESVAEPGAFIRATVPGESLIVVRDRAGVVHALYNVCRHRGTR